LRILGIEGTVSPERVAWATELVAVDELSLIGPGIGDQHLKELYRADHLQQIHLYNTNVTVAAAKKLQQALTHCEVDPDGNVLAAKAANDYQANVRVVNE
jgi:hypothetical protein